MDTLESGYFRVSGDVPSNIPDRRHPILIDPHFRIDPVMAGFLNRSRLAWLGRRPATWLGGALSVLVIAVDEGAARFAADYRLAGQVIAIT